MSTELAQQIDFYNKLIEQSGLSLALFNEKGLSVNPLMNFCVFIYIDHNHNCLRFYVKLAQLDQNDLDNSNLLKSLLALMGPARDFSCLTLGLTHSYTKLWASYIVDFKELEVLNFAEIYNKFLQQSSQLKDKVTQLLYDNRVGQTAQNPKLNLSEHTAHNLSADNKNITKAKDENTEDLMALMAESNVFWG